MAKKSIVSIASREAILKKKLRKHLRALGFQKSADGVLQIEGNSKDVIRKLHGSQREDKLKANKDFITEHAPELLKYFAFRLMPSIQRCASG